MIDLTQEPFKTFIESSHIKGLRELREPDNEGTRAVLLVATDVVQDVILPGFDLDVRNELYSLLFAAFRETNYGFNSIRFVKRF